MQLGLATQNLYQIVRDRAARWAGAVALSSQRGLAWQATDRRQLQAAVDRTAEDLAERGVAAGPAAVGRDEVRPGRSALMCPPNRA